MRKETEELTKREIKELTIRVKKITQTVDKCIESAKDINSRLIF